MLHPTAQMYAELQTAYDVLNARLFAGELPSCLITLQRRDSRCFGYFSHRRFGGRVVDMTTDEIALNPLMFKSHGQKEALQTLAHEMCHLWQYHRGTPCRKSYHDRQWADKMESIGLMPSSTGKPGGARTGQHMADYAIEGGPFETVAAELIAGPFSLAWYDRAAELMAEASAGVAVSMLVAPADVPALQAAIKAKKSKVAYGCSHKGCKAKAWGKPELHILCGEHGERMTPVEK